jgi:hypothetical protein
MCDGIASKMIRDIAYGGEDVEKLAAQDTADVVRK